MGTTPTERYLQGLARRSFLSLWSHGNPHTPEGRRGNKGAGKELCDLLVIFGENILLFSDKDIQFQRNIDIGIAWGRWYRRAVAKSADQLAGALKWLSRFPQEVYLDAHCTSRLPTPIPDISRCNIHLICIANGAYNSCRAFFGNSGIGSLVVDLTLKGHQQHTEPFHVGDVRPDEQFIHVFDEFTLNAAFGELDTAHDFIQYLTKREQFLRSEIHAIVAAGEEQLLAAYLSSVDLNGEHNFVLPRVQEDPQPSHIYFDETFWPRMLRSPEYRLKKIENDKSRAWDSLIEHFIKLGEYPQGSSSDFEWGLRAIASEPRLRRRQLAEALHGIYKKTPPRHRGARMLYSLDYPDRVYIFLLLPSLPSQADAAYREYRKSMLEAYCMVAKLRCPNAKLVIGLATEPRESEFSSEDLLAIDVSDWSDKEYEHARQIQEDTGILLDKNLDIFEGRILEYPISSIKDRSAKGFSVAPASQGATKSRRGEMQKKSRRANRPK
jgi:hypothetical protein